MNQSTSLELSVEPANRVAPGIGPNAVAMSRLAFGVGIAAGRR